MPPCCAKHSVKVKNSESAKHNVNLCTCTGKLHMQENTRLQLQKPSHFLKLKVRRSNATMHPNTSKMKTNATVPISFATGASSGTGSSTADLFTEEKDDVELNSSLGF